jgi:hypothetical protein
MVRSDIECGDNTDADNGPVQDKMTLKLINGFNT